MQIPTDGINWFYTTEGQGEPLLFLHGGLDTCENYETLLAELDANVLAENLIASFQGALLCAKIKKSLAPLNNFIDLYFTTFLRVR